MNDNYILDILGALDQNKSKRQINSDIKQLEKIINMLRITGTFAKGDTKKELNAYIKSLQPQLNYVKLKAKIDGKNVKREIDNALHGMKFKDIDVLNIDESKTKLKARKVIADVKALAEGSPITVNLEYRKNKLNNDLTTYLNKNTKITESSILLKESEKIRELIDSISDKKSLTEATDAFRLFKSEVSSTGFTSKSTADKIKSMLGHITKIGSAFGVASIAINNFVKSLQTLRSNDTIITEISKTSEMTKNQLKELEDEAFKIASKYGKLSSNFLLATQEMARAGYDDNVKEMAELSTKAQGAGDMTAELANKYIIATDKAFKMNGSIETLTATLDGANNITNNNALTMSDLGEAMSVVGSQAASSGMAVNETTAAVSTMIATTQRSGREMANAFKGILMNLRQVSGDVGDGEDIIDAESLTKYEKACAELGVSLSTVKDGIVSLKEPMQIIEELSEAYTQLEESDARRANLLSAVGGKYRANALNAILENYDMYEKMLKEYADGLGSMDAEAEKTANSWEGRLNSLQNSWNSLVSTLTNKEAILNGISLVDRLVQGVEKFVDIFGNIPTVLTAINSSMVAMHKDYGLTKIWDKESGKIDLEGNIFGIDFSAIKNQKKHFDEATIAIKRWNKELINGKADLDVFDNACVKNSAQLKEYLATCSKDAPASLSGYQQYLESTGQATEGLRLKTLLLNTALTMLGGIAVQLIVTGIQKAWDTLNVTVEEQTEKINNLKSSYEGLKSEYDELSQKQDITDAEKRRLEYLERRLELDERILKAEQAQLFDEKTGNKFTDLFDKDNLNTQYLGEMNYRNKDGYAGQKLKYDNKIDDISKIREQISEWKDLQATVKEGSKAWDEYQKRIDNAQNKETKYIDQLSEQENQLTINLGKYADNIEYLQSQLDSGDLTKDQEATAKEQIAMWKEWYDETDLMITQIQKLNGTYDYTAEKVTQKYNAALSNAKADLNGYSYSATGSMYTNETGRFLQDFWDENILSDRDEDLEQNIALWNKVTEGITDAAEAINAYTEAKKNTNDTEIEEAGLSSSITQTINQLNTQLKPTMDALKSAYQNIFTDDGFTLGNVDVSMLDSIQSAIEELNSMEDADINIDYSSFENLAKVLTDTSSTADDVHEAIDSFATVIVDSLNPAISECDGESYKLMQTLLESMGIVNAEEVLIAELGYSYEEYTAAKEAAANSGVDLNDNINEVAGSLENEGLMASIDAQQIMTYMVAKAAADGATINVDDTLFELAKEYEWLAELINQWGLYNTVSQKGHGNTSGTKNLGAGNYTPVQSQPAEEKVDVKFNGNGLKTGKTSGGGSGSSKDTWKEQYEKNLKELERLHRLGLISDEEYWKARMDLNEKYFGESSGMHEKYLEEYQENEEDILEGLKKLWEDYYDERKNNLKDLISYAEKLYDKEIDSLESSIKVLEEKRDTEEKIWQTQIDAIGDEIDALEDANDERERAVTIQQKQLALQRAMHMRTMLINIYVRHYSNIVKESNYIG